MHRDTFKQDNYSTVGGHGGCMVSEVRAGTTSPTLNHKGFKLQQLSEIHLPHFQVNFQKFSTLRVNSLRIFSHFPAREEYHMHMHRSYHVSFHQVRQYPELIKKNTEFSQMGLLVCRQRRSSALWTSISSESCTVHTGITGVVVSRHVLYTGSSPRSSIQTVKPLKCWISENLLVTVHSLTPLWSGMGEVVPARTSPTLHPPSPPTVHQLSRLAL